MMVEWRREAEDANECMSERERVREREREREREI